MDRKLSLIRALVHTLQLEVEAMESISGKLETEFDLNTKVREYEAKLIRTALIRAGGNQRRAAERLTMKASTLNAKLKLYNVSGASQ
jgi:DNA-binding NtrC family response regulator